MLTSLLSKQCFLLQVATLVLCTAGLRGEIFDIGNNNCESPFMEERKVPRNKEISCSHGDFGDQIFIKCDNFEESVEYEERNCPYKCIFTDRNGIVLDSYNETLNIEYDDDYTDETYLNIDLQVDDELVLIAEIYSPDGASCIYMNLKIIEESCAEEYLPAEMEETWTQKKRYCGVTLELDCQTPGFASCYNVTWYQNSTLLDDSHYKNDKNLSTLTVLDHEVTHTNFLCEVSQHGKVILKRHYDVCYQGGKRDNDIGLEVFSSPVEAQLGSSVTLSCTGKGGEVSMDWKKTKENSRDDPLCSLIPGVESHYQSSDGKYDCKMTSTAKESHPECLTPENCKKKLTGSFNTTFQINNVGKDDLGTYSCVATALGKPSISKNISLEEKFSRTPLTFAAGALAFLAGISIILLVASIAFHLYKIEMKLFWKRHLADFDPDDRTFAVFLSYCYNSESQEGTKELLHKLHDWFELKNYYVFDQHRNHSGELRHNLIRRMVPNCHRMVVVLTRGYMMNETTTSDANTGIQSSICGDTRLIFIVTPLFRDYFQRQLKAGNASCRAIHMSMGLKRNSVIYWKEKEQDKFFKALDVAMPKLRERSFISSKRLPLENDRLV